MDTVKARLTDAYDLAAAELREQEQQVVQLEKSLKAAKERRTELMAAVFSLYRLLPEEQRSGREPDLPTASKRPPSDREDEDQPMQAIMNMMMAADKDTVRVEEVQRFLDENGFGVSPRYASNTLKKLSEKGHFVRLGRGMYRWNGMHLSMPGLVQEDYDE
jgi:hypothetical protein